MSLTSAEFIKKKALVRDERHRWRMPKNGEGFALFFAQILALGCVVGSYIWLKNTFLSVALGIAGLNEFLWLLG